MTDLRNRFHDLDRVAAPGLWSDVIQRAAVPQPRPVWSFPSMNRFAAIALAAMVVVAALIGISLLVRPPSVGPPPSTPPAAEAQERGDCTLDRVTERVIDYTFGGGPDEMIELEAPYEVTLKPTIDFLLQAIVILEGDGWHHPAEDLPDWPTSTVVAPDGTRSVIPNALAENLIVEHIVDAPGTWTFTVEWDLIDCLQTVSVQVLSSGAWTATGEMVVGRYGHTATLLADGRVLVAGGSRSNGDVLASAELFDPETASWSPAADMLTPIADHTATLLHDGRVLVVGKNSSELYDPDTDSWRAAAHIASAGPVPSPGPATLLADGRVLITATSGIPRLYDPADDSWSLTGPMLTPRYNHVATLLADGSVLVAGGDVPPDVGLISAERYDPATNSWTATGDTARPRSHTGTLLPDGRVLDVGWTLGDGGPFGELYDPETGTWSSIDIPIAFRGSGAAVPLLPDGTVLFVSIDGDTALYDSASASWALGPPIVQRRWEPAVTLLANSDVLVAGGDGGRVHGGAAVGMSSAELYHPGSGQ